MKELALVSVIVPVYNAEKYIRRCIDSIINQTYRNLEIILVNDGSTDDSLKICYEYKEKDSRIIVLSQENIGAYKARKKAIEIATGKYVAFVDADDWIEQNMYYELVDIIEKNSTYLVESGIIDVNGNNEKNREPKVKEGHYKGEKFINEILPYMLYDGIFFESLISATLWNKLFLGSAVKEIFGLIQEGGRMGNDTVITYPYLVMNNDIYVTHKCYYHYRTVNCSITRNSYSDIYEKVNVHINVIKEFFEKSVYKDILMPQLYMHKLRIYAWFCPEIFDISSDSILNIYGGIKKDEKVVLYGAGKSGVKAYAYVHNFFEESIVAWVDKNYEYLSNEIDNRIKNPQDINYDKVDKVIVTVLKATAVDSIKKELKHMGVNEKKINWIPLKYIENPKRILDKIDQKLKMS